MALYKCIIYYYYYFIIIIIITTTTTTTTVRLRSLELYTLTNFIGKSPKTLKL